jgi:hypothetical protein
MVIAQVNAGEVLAGCRLTLGLPAGASTSIDEILLAALLRRTAGILCPCSRAALRSALLESLQYFGEEEAALADRIDSVIEGLIIGGDLLELSDVATGEETAKGSWVFAAPPSYVVRPGGSIFLTGIVPDQDTFLPQSLASRISHEGFTRVIVAKTSEDLSSELRGHGLQHLSESVWLKSPKAETAEAMLTAMKRSLLSQPASGSIGDLQILDPTQRVTYYTGRWTKPTNQTGAFVARRPQEYGAPTWCFVALQEGAPVRLLDLPLKKTRWRGCDAAWHLQMAIDYCNQSPQLFRRHRRDDGVRFDFFSPLPLWAQRRLMILGSPVAREKSLMSYLLPLAEAGTEERFLRARLWLSHTEDSD